MTRIHASGLLGVDPGDDSAALSSSQKEELERCRSSFRHFLRHWQFRNRETGEITSFEDLWPGQARLAELMETEPWLFALKAGKLGFTELACAFDGWVALTRPNARVHIFSRDFRAAQELLAYVRFGLTHLPEWLGLPLMADVAGGDTTSSLKLRGGTDDERTVVSYAAGPHVGIDQTAVHSHVDELSHMASPAQTWAAVQSTVAPGGSCHVITRGAGDDNFTAVLWEAASSGESLLTPYFAAWSQRPDRDRRWREEQAVSLPNQFLLHFAPETWDDALAGSETAIYIPAEIWDSCHDPRLPPLEPGDSTPLVLGVDAAVVGDTFAVVAVSRHPTRHEDPAIRACKLWTPAESGGRIDFIEVERFIRVLCKGGCAAGHPEAMPVDGCRHCMAGDLSRPPFKVVQIAYDAYQMEEMAQRLRKDRVAWVQEFSQQRPRLIADSMMHKLALRGALTHNGDRHLREHVLNVRAKLSKDEDSRLRMVKKGPGRPIDLAVAASMAIDQVLYLNL